MGGDLLILTLSGGLLALIVSFNEAAHLVIFNF